VWKNKWQILRQMPSYIIKYQMLIVVSTLVLHNFIRIHDKKYKGFKWNQNNTENLESSDDIAGGNIHDEKVKVVRDRITRPIYGP
jgi:hypothetical protein